MKRFITFSALLSLAAVTHSPRQTPGRDKPMAVRPAQPSAAPMPQVATSSAVLRQRSTNFIVYTLHWDAPPVLPNNSVSQCVVEGGDATGATNFTFTAPAASNSLSFLAPSDVPQWLAVAWIDSAGNQGPWSSNLLWNVASNGQCYVSNGVACLGFVATSGTNWQVVQVGTTNAIYSLTPTNNVLAKVPLPKPLPAIYRLTRQ